MKLGTTTLLDATLDDISPTAKQAVHQYDWSDECLVTDMGHGPTTLRVSGLCSTLDERLDVIAACEEARTTETNLYYPSIIGASDDYYYRVFTSPARLTAISSTLYRYSFQAIAVVPWIYDASSGERVT